MENDLISRKAVLKKSMNVGLCDAYGGYYGNGVVVLIDDIKAAPTVDAVEIKDLRKQLLKEGTLLYGGNVEFEKRIGGYNPSSFVAGFNYALERMSGWTTSLNGERRSE